MKTRDDSHAAKVVDDAVDDCLAVLAIFWLVDLFFSLFD